MYESFQCQETFQPFSLHFNLFPQFARQLSSLVFHVLACFSAEKLAPHGRRLTPRAAAISSCPSGSAPALIPSSRAGLRLRAIRHYARRALLANPMLEYIAVGRTEKWWGWASRDPAPSHTARAEVVCQLQPVLQRRRPRRAHPPVGEPLKPRCEIWRKGRSSSLI